MTQRYDLLVIGSGTAAGVAARRARAAKWSVAVVDFRPFGGTCALRGCDAKKMLRSGPEVVDHVRRMRAKGTVGDVHIDWPALMARKQSAIEKIPERTEKRFTEAGIATYHAQAKFLGPDVIDVGGERVEAGHVLLACGAEPRRLGLQGEEHLVTSDEFMSLGVLPPSIVFVGGGYIAAELAHIAARSGSRVTILQSASHLLPEFEADLVVHAAGREPALRRLDLQAGDVATNGGRLVLNEFLQSASNPRVYAAGDAAQVGPPLTPVADHDASVAVANMIDGNRHRPNYAGVPSVAFTIPPIAAVGLREAEARERGLRFRVSMAKVSDWFTARRQGEPT